MSSPHLFLDLSAHGLGHLAQAAPVVNALHRRVPDLRLTVRGGLPRAAVEARIGADVAWRYDASNDVGLCMASAIDVRPAQTLEAYRQFHREWSGQVDADAALLDASGVTLLLSAVPYRSLAAAHRLGLPAVALSSLNWAALFRHYCGHLAETDGVHQQMLSAYHAAEVFLRLTPAPPMPELGNVRDIGPVAALGRNRRAEIQRRLQVPRRQRLALIALGGIDTRLAVERWPRLPDVTWLAPAAWRFEREDFRGIPEAGFSYVDLVASCDAVIAKPGYGTFVEAACHGVPVVYVARDDWPETPYLASWLRAHVPAVAVERERFWRGALAEALEAVLAEPPRTPAKPTGVEEAAAYLHDRVLGR
ncbi:MAG: hypothetical protein GWN84_22995 [Gammaproteobacteria bacterium]|nr:hypothetical protein [Gammaproteobacteria bacterium]NIR85476.1 hypothetical protein [Gammaproteobacteria bacterium]NIR89528.1 hypothetical protein [Gammaproteobacteria bacterium]NIU06613.1 hypothetical protein [Gammaproteobacteria bacterium]NIV53496.1 hypothetical protein [Gammaproteobacteria bacterium]